MPFLVFDLVETQRSADEVGSFILLLLFGILKKTDFSHTMKISLRVFLNILPAVLP